MFSRVLSRGLATAARGAVEKNFKVSRIDTHGNWFLVKEGLTQKDAEALAKHYEEKGHRQGYYVHASDTHPMQTPAMNRR